MPIDPTTLTPTQLQLAQAMADDDVTNVFWVGPIRSGKTAGMAIAAVEMALTNAALDRGNHRYILAGQTVGAVRRNTADYFEDVCKHYGLRFREGRGEDSPVYKIGDFAEFYLFGGDNARSYAKVRGMTVTSAFIDEATLLHDDFLTTVRDRCSFDCSKVVYFTNADSPYHPFKQKYLDDPPPKSRYLESTFQENQHYSAVRRADLLAHNSDGHLYKRNILNTWAPAAGLVFPIGSEHVVSYPKPEQPAGLVGFDLGIEGITAAVLVVAAPYGFHILDEYWHDGRQMGVLTDEMHMERILAKWQPTGWVPDPSAVSFKAVLRQHGQLVKSAPKPTPRDVMTGIQVVNNALHADDATGKRLTIDARCVRLLSEASAYVWNPVTDKPVKQNDHACDAMRYVMRELMPPTYAVLSARGHR